jgi:cob(I)alamin adenosyltransferase
MKVYTKQGDNGLTKLGCGSCVSKSHPSINAIGAVDELNALLGVIISKRAHIHLLQKIQKELFEIGAQLCLISSASEKKSFKEIDEAIIYMEKQIDEMTESITPLKNFILPGGIEEAALIHLARTVCRRAEREVVSLISHRYHWKDVSSMKVVVYLNRLSDLLFTMARYTNNLGKDDIIWKSP